MAEHRTTQVRVEQKSKAPHPTVWLEIDYVGTEPPVDFFADLEMIGWRPPVPAAPPASAIDWSTPNAETGERFTIRPWQVGGAVAEPPKGSASRGHWTAAEREVFLLSLDGVLRRHGLAEEPADDRSSSAPPAAGASAAATQPAVDLTDLPPPPDGPSATTDAPPTVSSSARPADVTGSSANEADAGAGASSTTMVRAEIKPSLCDRVAAALAPLGVTAHFGETTKTITNSYRGSSFETTVTVTTVEALVAASLAETTAAVLRDQGLTPTLHAAPDPVEGAPTSGLPVAGVAVDDNDEQRIVRVLVPATKRAKADALLAPVAVERPTAEPTTVTVLNTYRGSTFEADEPGVAISCRVRAADAGPLVERLATALGFAADDPSRLTMEMVEGPRAAGERGTRGSNDGAANHDAAHSSH